MARTPSLAGSPAIEDAVAMMHAAARQGSPVADLQVAVADALGVLPAQVEISVEQGTRTSIGDRRRDRGPRRPRPTGDHDVSAPQSKITDAEVAERQGPQAAEAGRAEGFRGARMRARVIGIDPGLANLGIAEVTYNGHGCTSLVTRHEKTHPPATPTDDQTAARMSRMIRAAAPVGDPWLCEGCGYTHNPAPSDLVMVMLEGPSYGSDTKYSHESAGLWWRLRSLLTSRGIPVGKCPPATLKVWAADHGRASKAQMKMALDRLWPGVLASTEHEVDAALLALAAAQRLGWFAGGEPLRQANALGKMTWPQLPDVRPVSVVST